MFYRRNSDEQLRKLEREVIVGNALAETLKAARKRAGVCEECGGTLPEYYTVCLKCRPLELSWNTLEIAEGNVEYLIEQSIEEVNEGMRDEPLTPEQALELAFGDHLLYEYAKEYIDNELTEWLNIVNPDYRSWCVSGRNMGWRRRSGYKHIQYEDGNTGAKMLGQILPDTECTYTIYFDGESLEMSNSHHDGSESYSIGLALQCSHCEEEYCVPEELDECCKYMCEICNERYSDHEDAESCCPG